MNQSEIVLHRLFKVSKYLAETVEKGVDDFNHPASSLKVRITFNFFALLTSGTDMSSVLTLLNRLGYCLCSRHPGKDSAYGLH